MVKLDLDTPLLPPRFRILLRSWAGSNEASWCWELEAVYRKAASERQWERLGKRMEKMKVEQNSLLEELSTGEEVGSRTRLQKELALLEVELGRAESNVMGELLLQLCHHHSL